MKAWIICGCLLVGSDVAVGVAMLFAFKHEPTAAESLTTEEVALLKEWAKSDFMKEAGRPHKAGAF